MIDVYEPRRGFEIMFQLVPVIGWGTLVTAIVALSVAAYAVTIVRSAMPRGHLVLLVAFASVPAFCGLLFSFFAVLSAIAFVATPPSAADPHDLIDRLVWMPLPAITGLGATLLLLP